MAQPPTTGSRLREERLRQKIRQGDLAARVGISASYLNLIEHDHRRIGGRLLHDLAQALGQAPDAFAEGAGDDLVAALNLAAAQAGAKAPRAEALASAHPQWARLVVDQARQIAALRDQLAQLSDRLAHNPQLAASVHELLSTVTSIRSAAAILTEGDDLDRDWQRRFHSNIHQDALRLTEGATGLIAALEDPGQAGEVAPDEAERFFAQRGGHIAALEQGAAPEQLMAEAGLSGPAQQIVLGHLRRMARDCAALPLAGFEQAARQAEYDPLRLALRLEQPLARVLRRLAALPPGPHPRLGLAICDGAGAVIFRQPVEKVALPRGGTACPLWPLFGALARPGHPVVARAVLPGGPALRVWAVADLRLPAQGHQLPLVEATMLLRPDAGAEADTDIALGPGCGICPREDCPARRGPSVLVGDPGDMRQAEL